ncbi:hypothetical protein E2C01_056930 [Portunus trituberculatus]|uniref:Uncharacterized protein n=1 Tax=Portunus trituberculatus TaxID=210409 RepID=A0A5B7GS57_PORTR|nr:hypothetical protein [Portunus trituberculatus]
MRIEKAGGNREWATVSCLRQLCFGEEKKMRFSREEVVFHRLKIRSKTANVAEVNIEKLREKSRHLWSSLREASDLGTYLIPSQKGTPMHGQAETAPLSCETQKKTFSEITTSFDGRFTTPPELVPLQLAGSKLSFR